MILAKCGKISDVQTAGSDVTAVLKKAVLAIRKSCDSYHEKAVPTVRKSCLLWAEANEVRWVLSNCWEGHFDIYFMDLAENDKDLFEGYLAIFGITAGCWYFSIKWLMISLPTKCQVLNTTGVQLETFPFLGCLCFWSKVLLQHISSK